ncbi:hypothetical protein LWI28_012757 [Acer negundo]|uniref:Uncharacterized protein n=1 Tax=Acer negundo TaxID=4023 RepID=A0AAD5NVK6_ACENE|nr:hypothetical protein LWI28_012757 [Acer negundo]
MRRAARKTWFLSRVEELERVKTASGGSWVLYLKPIKEPCKWRKISHKGEEADCYQVTTVIPQHEHAPAAAQRQPNRRAAAFSSDVVPRPVAHPKQQPRSPSGLRCFSYGDVKHRQSECKKVVFFEPEDSQEELVENIGVEPIFDEEEEVQEEDVGVGEEPQFDVVETMEEDLVDSDAGALEQRLCAEGQQFEEEDEAETRDELQFDGEEMVTEDWVEGDVGPLLMVRPAVITIIDDVNQR